MIDAGKKFALSVLVIVRYIFIIKCGRVSVLINTLIVIIGARVICIESSYVYKIIYTNRCTNRDILIGFMIRQQNEYGYNFEKRKIKTFT